MSDTVRAKRLVHRDPPWVDKLYDIIDDLYRSHKRETKITQKKTFAPSSIGYGHGRCAKYWYMAFSGEHEFEDTTTARSIAIMSNGTYVHERLQKLIGESGMVVSEEEEMLISDPPIRGFADLILKIQLDDETVIPVIEIKSTMQEAFVHRQATHKPSPYHLIQLLIYLKATGLTEGAVLYENKNCVPEYSRIMTKSGWKHHSDLVVGEDEILTYSPERHTLEWEPYQHKVAFPFKGNLMRVGNKHNSFISTPDHKWPVRLASGRREIRYTQDLNSNSWIPRVADLSSDESETIVSPRAAEVIGWIASDGTIDKRPRGYYTIWQEKEAGKKLIEDLLEDGEYSKVYRNGRHIGYYLKNGALVDEIRRVFKDREVLPELVTKMNSEARAAYIRGLLGGDGSWANGGNGVQFGQRDGAVKESYQIANYLNGAVVNINKGKMSCYPSVRKEFRAYSPVDVEYDGELWCPVTKNGYWVMEQHGKPTITGNTQEILIIPVKMDDKNYELIERVFEWLRTVYSAYEQGLEPRRPVKRRDSVICKQCPLRKACWDGEDKGVIDIPIMEMPKL